MERRRSADTGAGGRMTEGEERGTRVRAARLTVIAMIGVLVLGAAATALLIRSGSGAAETGTRDAVVRDGHQLAVAVNAYDAGGLVEEQAQVVAALTSTPTDQLPEWLRGYGARIEQQRSQGRDATVEQLRSI